MRLIRRLIVQAEAIEQQIELFEDRIIPKTEQALQVSAADYRVNKVDFQQILDNWSDLLMFHLQVTRFEANLNQTLASLERVVGCQLATLPETQIVPIDAFEPGPALRALEKEEPDTDPADETGDNELGVLPIHHLHELTNSDSVFTDQ